jgi:hypothetical protein
MNTNTLTNEQARNLIFVRDLGGPSRSYVKKNEKGVQALIIEGKPIFRSGTFSDSMGFEHTWEPLHMTQMLDHYTLLSNREIFADVPVRKGHADWGGIFSDPVRNAMDELIGYLGNLRVEKRTNPTDGVEYDYLLADLEILDEEAQKKINSGLWRNVSAEISGYRTNANAEYWPVMMGLAYVDLPAVEGLKAQHSKSNHNFSLILEDDQMDPVTGTQPAPAAPKVPEVPKVVAHSAPVADPPAPTVAPKKENEPFEFTIGGNKSTNFQAVQSYISGLETRNTALETFKKETIDAGKVSFVKGLVSSNRISAPQEAAYLEYAQSLVDPAQYDAWRKLEESKSPLTLLSRQGVGFSGSPEDVIEHDAAGDQIESLKGIISMHQAGGMSRERIEETDTYKALKVLDKDFIF